MIRYLELTAPEESQFRQAKIVSIEINEGDQVTAGDTLFKVLSGKQRVDLPATMPGKVTEVIATVGENISLMTPLLLLETKVERPSKQAEKAATETVLSTQSHQSVEKTTEHKTEKTKPVENSKPKKKARSVKKRLPKQHQQQQLDLSGNQTVQVNNVNTTTQNIIEISVPDIGADAAKVIEILVNVGDQVSVDDSIVTLESDKASMDVPTTHAGIIKSIAVAIDQDVSEGAILMSVEVTEASATEAVAAPQVETPEPALTETPAPTVASSTPSIVDVHIPDIGGDSAKVIEILVTEGQEVATDESLVTLESDKASMDIPSTANGVVKKVMVKLDDQASEGDVVVQLETTETAPAPEATPSSTQSTATPATQTATAAPTVQTPAAVSTPSNAGNAHATPSVRRLARELGIDLSKVGGTGRKGRVSKDDLKAFVKGVMSGGGVAANTTSDGAGIPPIPAVDFSKFGDIDVQPLNKIKRLTASNLHRSWLNVPHVTHNDESNISDLEAFRKQLNAEYAKQKKDIKLSPLAFIVKAVVSALQTYPQFNSSLEPGGENLIYKQYYNVGIAVETPNGLVVPVIKNADKLSVPEIAQEMGILAKKARDKKLSGADMSGGCFTISSLGGIGGTHFTPIVNAPEVAILGVSRTKVQPVWNGTDFEPGQMLPLSLSYDHRVIDGAEAARFTRHIAAVLEDLRRLAI